MSEISRSSLFFTGLTLVAATAGCAGEAVSGQNPTQQGEIAATATNTIEQTAVTNPKYAMIGNNVCKVAGVIDTGLIDYEPPKVEGVAPLVDERHIRFSFTVDRGAAAAEEDKLPSGTVTEDVEVYVIPDASQPNERTKLKAYYDEQETSGIDTSKQRADGQSRPEFGAYLPAGETREDGSIQEPFAPGAKMVLMHTVRQMSGEGESGKEDIVMRTCVGGYAELVSDDNPNAHDPWVYRAATDQELVTVECGDSGDIPRIAEGQRVGVVPGNGC
jgi:hypothetical protein